MFSGGSGSLEGCFEDFTKTILTNQVAVLVLKFWYWVWYIPIIIETSWLSPL